VQSDPTEIDYLAAEAECLVALGRPEEARERVLESMDLSRPEGTLDMLLAEINLVLGDPKAAAEALQRAMPYVGHDPLVAEEYGLLSASLGRFAEAVAVLEPLMEADGEYGPSGAAVRALVQSYLEIGHLEAGASLVRDWLQDHADDTAAWLLQGRAALARGDLKTACRSSETAARLAPQNAEAHLIRGYACWQRGEADRAQQALERALSLDPDDAVTHCLLAQVLSQRGRPGQARHHWLRALQIDPHSAWARDGLARASQPEPEPDRLASRS
jgi:Flp pilus assembly protein TadD